MTNATTPKQHMVTDSCENKRTRQQPNHSDMSESDYEGQGSTKKQAMEVHTAPPIITQPIALPTTPANPWQFLQSGTTNRSNTVNGVITLQNGLKITAPPIGGFPSPQLGQWPQKAGPKAWVRTFRAKFEDNTQMMNIKIHNLIALTIGEAAMASLLLSTLSAEGDLYECFPPPHHFLISRIPQAAIMRLTGLVWKVTWKSQTSSNKPSTYTQTSLFIHNHIPTPDAEAAIKVINSICIASLNVAISHTISHTVWNIYADSLPNMSLKDYFEWTNLIRNLQFASEDYGTGLVRSEEEQFLCTGCKSYDHPTGLCPFPKVLGWFGPVSTMEDTTNVSLDNRSHITQSRGNTHRGGWGTVSRGQGRRRWGRGQY
ncbi:hypothetical protein EDD22DRAFT_960105 [Suillus occidentalis]|nr:hypothetical protein EDD22DRAFT_960105 [Suillus occidentalis]